MINAVMAGITDALYGEFGNSYEIYKEASMQDMKEPAFFVQSATPEIKKQLTDRWKAELLFTIQYFPESAEPKQEMNDIFCRLAMCLDLIRVDGRMVRGVVECRDTSKDVLTATAEYALYLTRTHAQIYMEQLEMRQEVKDG